jgi:hypothetical protein
MMRKSLLCDFFPSWTLAKDSAHSRNTFVNCKYQKRGAAIPKFIITLVYSIFYFELHGI